MVQGNLDRGITNDRVTSKNIPQRSGSDKDPIRIAYDRVVFDDIICIGGTGQSDPEIASLSRISISTNPVRTEPVAFRAGQSYAPAGGGSVSVPN